MSTLESEIRRIKSAKAALKDAITEKGVAVADTALIDEYAGNVSDIESGADVSNVTVTAGDMLSGKIAVDKDGNEIVGNIPTVTPSKSGNVVTVPAGHIASEQKVTVGTAKSAATITPGTANQTIAANTYLTGKQTIKGDANLLPENIKKDVSIFGVVGEHEGGGTELYKCVSVDTTTKTWSGYKATLTTNDEGKSGFVIEETVTEGLSYGGGFTPKIGTVYDSAAMVKAELYYLSEASALIDEYTEFLLFKGLTDVSGNNIPVTNYGLTTNENGIVYTADKYAEIPAETLPDTVMCDGKDWSIEIKFRCADADTWKNNGDGCALWGLGDGCRFDLIIRAYSSEQYKIEIGGFPFAHYGAISHIASGEWCELKITHSSSNNWASYFMSDVKEFSKTDQNMREYEFPIGAAIDWGDISRQGYPFEVEYLRISSTIR